MVASPAQVNAFVSGTVSPNSEAVFSIGGLPTEAQSWSLAFNINNGQYTGVSIGTTGTPAYYVTPGSPLSVTAVSLNNGILTIIVQNTASTNWGVAINVGGLVV